MFFLCVQLPHVCKSLRMRLSCVLLIVMFVFCLYIAILNIRHKRHRGLIQSEYLQRVERSDLCIFLTPLSSLIPADRRTDLKIPGFSYLIFRINFFPSCNFGPVNAFVVLSKLWKMENLTLELIIFTAHFPEYFVSLYEGSFPVNITSDVSA